MLSIQDLSISIAGTSIVSQAHFIANPGTTIVLQGSNGSGKSSLIKGIIGHPDYQITSGSIFLNNIDILALSAHERARAGIFAVLQHAIAIPGLSILTFLHEAYMRLNKQAISVEALLAEAQKAFETVGLDQSFLYKSVHEHFSGGEQKRFELAQVLIFKPACVILDEIDSGMDTKGVELVASIIKTLMYESHTTFLLVSHNQTLVKMIEPAHIYVMHNGTLHG